MDGKGGQPRAMVTVAVASQLEDHEYKPLDPKDIRLPPPMPPSERLLAAVEAFYSPPSHDRPRNRCQEGQATRGGEGEQG